MAQASPSPGKPDTKRAKLRKSSRQQTVIALQLQGLTQTAIAEQLGVERRTIARDVKELKPSTEQVLSILERGQERLRETYPIEKRIDRLAKLSESAVNESVSMGCVTYLNEFDGVVTERERMRINKQTEAPTIQPMFMLPPGTSVSIRMSTPERDVINVTPTDGESEDVT